MKLIVGVCGSLALVVQAGAATPTPATVPPPAPSQLLQLGRGDQVQVEVFGNPEMATLTNVTDDGSIHMPLAGPVKIAGDSPAEAARKIEAALKAAELLVNPQVSVTVVRSLSQRVSVVGEVGQQGRYVIESDSTVLDVIAMAGGITEKGSDVVYIVRADAAGKQQRLPVNIGSFSMVTADGLPAPMPILHGGDVIQVPKATFTITGEVASQGEYRIEGDMLLFEAIARAGGVTPLGSANRVEIKRRGPDGKSVTIKGEKDMRVQSGDVIRVKERLF